MRDPRRILPTVDALFVACCRLPGKTVLEVVASACGQLPVQLAEDDAVAGGLRRLAESQPDEGYDPERAERLMQVLEVLGAVWLGLPDLRLGQLVFHATNGRPADDRELIDGLYRLATRNGIRLADQRRT